MIKTKMSYLLARYDALALDAFGVILDESGARVGAVQLIDHLNSTQKPYWIVTNGSSRNAHDMAAFYQEKGLNIASGRVITSGCLMRGYFEEHQLHGVRAAVLGTQSAKSLAREVGAVIVDPLDSEEFELLVVSNQTDFPFLESIDAVISAIMRRRDRGGAVRLLLTNPDLIYPKGAGMFGLTSGSIALVIEAALDLRYPGHQANKFDRLGKPYSPIFTELCLRAGSKNIVMIGDQIETDIKGALSFGLDAALYTQGVVNLSSLPQNVEWVPTYILDELWDGKQ